MAPLGVPVVPLVKCSSAGSSGCVATDRRNRRMRRAISAPQIERARHAVVLAVLAHQQHVLQRGQLRAHPLPPCAGRATSVVTSTLPCPRLMPRGDRLRTEGGEQRRHHTPVLQAAEHGDIELGNAPGEHEQAIALADAQGPQHVGKAVGQARQFGIRDDPGCAFPAQPTESGSITQRVRAGGGRRLRMRC